MLEYEKILEEIIKRTNISKEELEKRIFSKQEELSGLISQEGAAYLVAKELGIDLESRKRLEIKDIVAGMRNINIVGRVFRISNITKFKKADGGEGKVASVFIADSTGFVRLPLWNDQVKIVEEGLLKPGSAIQVVNGIAKENIFGDVEISLGKYGSIKEVEAEGLPSLEEISTSLFKRTERVSIKNLKPGNYEVKGTILHVFKNKLFFYVCPVCNSRVEESKCKEHGEVEAVPELVISCILDDGTSNIRTVFFRETAEKLLGLTAEELQSSEQSFDVVEERLLGKEIIVSGRVKKNKIFDRLELIANDFKDLNAKEETEKLIEGLNLPPG
ncbi:MAG: DUF2240 family protein [Candidatus Aenigmatarchaeota archaeon]